MPPEIRNDRQSRVEPPEILAGRYRLTSVLGQGGMGTVWRAEDLELGAPVAVKLMNHSAADSEEALRHCQKEARAAAALRSPHVVQVLAVGKDQTSGNPFIVMELLEGESLADRLRRLGKLSPAKTSRVLTHVARALGRAHEAAILHRDLKPANVFLVRNADEELAKVLDFGTARVRPAGVLNGSTTTPTGAIVGTPYCMSPEHISGQPVDHRTDLWAMAVMAFECLTGRRPFDARDIGQLVLQICTYPIPVPSMFASVPPGFDAWFQRATQREIDRRFPSAREQAEELRRVCEQPVGGGASTEGAPEVIRTQELPPPTGAVAPPAAGRRRTVRWVIAASVVALTTAATVAATRALLLRSAPTAAAVPATAAAPRPAVLPAPPASAQTVAPPAPRPAEPSVAAPARALPALVRSERRRRTPRQPPTASGAPAPAPAPPAPAPDESRMESVLDHRR